MEDSFNEAFHEIMAREAAMSENETEVPLSEWEERARRDEGTKVMTITPDLIPEATNNTTTALDCINQQQPSSLDFNTTPSSNSNNASTSRGIFSLLAKNKSHSKSSKLRLFIKNKKKEEQTTTETDKEETLLPSIIQPSVHIEFEEREIELTYHGSSLVKSIPTKSSTMSAAAKEINGKSSNQHVHVVEFEESEIELAYDSSIIGSPTTTKGVPTMVPPAAAKGITHGPTSASKIGAM